MNLMELITNNGKLSHTKLWSNIGLFAMTITFLYRALYGNIQDYEMEMLVYGIVVTAPNLLGKFLNVRFGSQPVTNEKQEVNNA